MHIWRFRLPFKTFKTTPYLTASQNSCSSWWMFTKPWGTDRMTSTEFNENFLFRGLCVYMHVFNCLWIVIIFIQGKKEKGWYFTQNADGFYLLQVTSHMTTEVSRSGNCQISYCILLTIFTKILNIMRYFVISFIKALNRENWHWTVRILHLVREWYQRKLTWELKKKFQHAKSLRCPYNRQNLP